MSRTKQSSRTGRKSKLAMAVDVAKLAGVSLSAVSRTFTAGASVSELTRKKVLDAARQLRYRPAQSLRSPTSKGSHIVGVAVANLDNLFYSTFLEKLSDALAEIGYRILVFVTHGHTEMDPVVNELLHFRVDALVLASTSLSFPLADECQKFGIPVVMFNAVSPATEAASVAGANFFGARTVGSFLVAGEHRRIAFMAGVDDGTITVEREAGFKSALLSHGFPEPIRVRGHFSYQGAVEATRDLLTRKQRPDAIFCANDIMAIATVQTVRLEFGLVPGKDISIVGFDGSETASWPAFDLTSYSQPLDRMISRIVDMLSGFLEGKPNNRVHEVVPGELVVRGSARIPAEGVITHKDGHKTWSAE